MLHLKLPLIFVIRRFNFYTDFYIQVGEIIKNNDLFSNQTFQFKRTFSRVTLVATQRIGSISSAVLTYIRNRQTNSKHRIDFLNKKEHGVLKICHFRTKSFPIMQIPEQQLPCPVHKCSARIAARSVSEGLTLWKLHNW